MINPSLSTIKNSDQPIDNLVRLRTELEDNTEAGDNIKTIDFWEY